MYEQKILNSFSGKIELPSDRIIHVGVHLDNYAYMPVEYLTKMEPIVKINGIPFLIGSTGILEIDDINITSIEFLNTVDGYIELEVEKIGKDTTN